MKSAFFIRLGICCVFLGSFLYTYVNKKNDITEIQLRIPGMVLKLQSLNEEVKALQFLVDKFEGPENLMHLSTLPEYGHLRSPLESEIIYLSLDEN